MPTLKLKLFACTVSGALMGAAGAPLPMYLSFIEPASTFSLNYSVSALAMPIIGGTAHWIGPVIGGAAARLGAADRHRHDLERDQRAGGRRAAGGVRRRRARRHPRPVPEVAAGKKADERPLLQVEGVSKHFGGFTALSEVSIDIAQGERFGLIGPNGSGKTTLINCISGALRNDSGSIVFDGEDI